jgi:hypothetical protein
MTGWTYLRFVQHQSRFPPDERAARNKEAQARFRERHADDRAGVRRVANLLNRRLVRDASFVAGLARAIRTCLDDDVARRLGAELRRVSADRRRRV